MSSSQRKSPMQKRSAATITSILDASAQLLDREGYQELSTNQIAKEAHVAIGTVYRYFSDKDAIIQALRVRAEDDIMHRLVATLASAASMPTADGVRAVLTALVGAIEDHQGLMTAVINDMPLGIQSNVLPNIEQQLYHIARLALLQRYPELPESDIEEMLYLGMGMMLHVALRIAIGRPAHMDRESLIDRAALAAMIASPVIGETSGTQRV